MKFKEIYSDFAYECESTGYKEKFGEAEVIEVYDEFEDREKFNSYKLQSKIKNKVLDYYSFVYIIKLGNRYYEVVIFNRYARYGEVFRFKFGWLKYYNMPAKLVEEKKKQEAKRKARKKAKVYTPDLSYRTTDEWKKYQSVLTDSRLMGETNDCVVVALTLATGEKYEKIHQMLEEEGRKPRQGTYYHQYKAALKKLGYKMVLDESLSRTYNEGTGGRGYKHKTVRNILDKVDPNKRYLINTRRHLFAAIGGVVLDCSRHSLKRVKKVYTVEKI